MLLVAVDVENLEDWTGRCRLYGKTKMVALSQVIRLWGAGDHRSHL